MARKSDYISMGYRINSTAGLRGAEVLQAMYDSARMSEPLPEGLDVEWRWQNAPHQAWHEEDFSDVVTGDSSAGFLTLMLRRIRRDAGRFGVSLTDTEIRESTEREAEAIEEIQTEREEAEETPRRAGEGTRLKAAREKRSAAAKKAAATRKQHQAAEKRKAAAMHRKRSAAAKRGWITRRRNEAKRKRGKRNK